MNFPTTILLAAPLILAVASTTTGHLPPNSRTQGTRFLAAYVATYVPVLVEPVNSMTSTLDETSVLAT